MLFIQALLLLTAFAAVCVFISTLLKNFRKSTIVTNNQNGSNESSVVQFLSSSTSSSVTQNNVVETNKVLMDGKASEVVKDESNFENKIKMDPKVEEEMNHYKTLYHKLQNLDKYPEILDEAKTILLSLFSQTLHEAQQQQQQQQNSDLAILSVSDFSLDSLSHFLEKIYNETNQRWEQYMQERRAGGPKHIFSNLEEAKWWLKNSAPVKFVDGAWLGGIHKLSTPFEFRNVTKTLWQIMSEELGDGDLAKNHVYIYQQLLQDINCNLPKANDIDFIDSKHELNQPQVWKAAVTQLIVSLFPHQFLPEILGFNLSYESLPLHLLKTCYELKEFNLNPYYFILHVSIDNAHSGHSAMGVKAISTYLSHINETLGPNEAAIHWRRIQAGFILAEGLPTTPVSPSILISKQQKLQQQQQGQEQKEQEDTLEFTEMEQKVVKIFNEKAPAAHKVHCSSKMKFGGKTLVEWLNPEQFKDPKIQKQFLEKLSNLKPWVVKGNVSSSLLVKEIVWGGRMFGAFTDSEVGIVKQWILSLSQVDNSNINNNHSYKNVIKYNEKHYLEFTKRRDVDDVLSKPSNFTELYKEYPVFNLPSNKEINDVHSESEWNNHVNNNSVDSLIENEKLEIDLNKMNWNKLKGMWFTSTALLENCINVPCQISNEYGGYLIRILRAQLGFLPESEGVAGMDEVLRIELNGLIEIGLNLNTKLLTIQKGGGEQQKQVVKNIAEIMEKDKNNSSSTTTIAFEAKMVRMGMKPWDNMSSLLGMSWAFALLHEQISQQKGNNQQPLDPNTKQILQAIAQREKSALQICLKKLCFEAGDNNTTNPNPNKFELDQVWKGFTEAKREIQKAFVSEELEAFS